MSQAGSTVSCVKCGYDVRVPGLRELKRLNSIDVSPLGRLRHSIEQKENPFDGSCQTCRTYQGMMILPVNLVVSSSEEEVAGAFAIPCVFCEMCANEFRKGLWVGRLKSLGSACLGAAWLLIVLIVASLLAIALPFIGLVFVLAVLSGMVYHLTRRRANPYLLGHLNRICKLSEVLKDVEEYVLKSDKMRRLPNQR